MATYVSPFRNRNPLRSVADYEKDYAEADLAKQQVSVNQLKVIEGQRAIEDDNALKAYYRQNDPRSADFSRGLGGISPKAMYSHEKSMLDQAKGRADIANTGVETAGKVLEQFYGAIGRITEPAQGAEVLKALYANQVTGPIVEQYIGPIDGALQRLARAAQTPEGFRDWQAKTSIGMQKLAELLKIQQTDNGQYKMTTSVQPATGEEKLISMSRNYLSPAEQQHALDAEANRQNQIAIANSNAASRGTSTSADKPPAGYRWKADGTLEAIPGGPADIKADEKDRAKSFRSNAAVDRANTVIKNIDDALSKTGFFTTGLTGAVIGKFPGTSAYDLRATVDTIKANIGFAELQAMREASPTGGALGQVAVQELDMLQAVLGKLDPNQSEPQTRKQLGEARKHYENWKKVMQQGGYEGTNTRSVTGEDVGPAGMPSQSAIDAEIARRKRGKP
jgi:hypothetical protein